MARKSDYIPAGRPKGCTNKTTRGVRHNILDVFDKIGGVKNFAAWAQENQTEFYKHYTRLAPAVKEVSGIDGQPIEFSSISITEDQVRRMAEQVLRAADPDGTRKARDEDDDEEDAD